MRASEIRKKFLNFFKSKEHTIVESDLLVPKNDPTLLFTGAGMNQFKEQFMGKNITYKRAASCQKCMRTADVENVGKTPRHHTFFEMLGNFSFGDYFKKDAITWGWDFMTKEMSIPEDRLWISVYKEDEESYDIWAKDIEVPEERIVRLGAKDNFWPANAPSEGPNGPCGPCSEIFYDWGKNVGCGKADCSLECDCGRFVEIWNLVFTEFERKPDGCLDPLPNKNIDTGMGLERIASVMQNVCTNFETDIFEKVNSRIREELGDGIFSSDIYVVADHVRAAVFAICDGVSPSNEKQGYVIRKLIRRAYLKGSFKEKPFLFNIVPSIVKVFKEEYPELDEKREHIAAIIEEEEKRFVDTLRSTMPIFEEMLTKDPKNLEGDKIFKLVDTYGMPLEVIQSITRDRGIDIDLEDFERLMSDRKEQSRKGSDITCDFIFKPDDFDGVPTPENVDEMPLDTKLEFIVKNGNVVNILNEDDCAEIVTLPQSARFYAESGGQVGDTGTIIVPGAKMDIVNTIETNGKKVLQVVVKKGSFKKGDTVTLDLDSEKKNRTAKNHTATHLLQAALRQVLGEQVKQSGSFVNDKRLRFDFTYMKKLTRSEFIKVEDIVNGWINEETDVRKEVKTLDEAKAEGALSFFGEKYGNEVRVITVGSRSKELCGGTHVDNTKEIGLVKITGESSIASGIRRIEAVTNDTAKDHVKDVLSRMIGEIKELSKNPDISQEEKKAVDIVTDKLVVDAAVVHEFEEEIRPALLEKLEKLRKAEKQRKKTGQNEAFNEARQRVDEFLKKRVKAGKINVISGVLENTNVQVLRSAATYLEKKAGSSVVILGGREGEKAALICIVSADLLEKGLNAKELIDAVAGEISGGGGGKPLFAQAGGTDASGLEKAMDMAKELILEKEQSS